MRFELFVRKRRIVALEARVEELAQHLERATEYGQMLARARGGPTAPGTDRTGPREARHLRAVQ